MGALGPDLSSWIPEDDLLLKNAIEAGASLESLAKGAVQFSRKFTFEELRDRWYSLLYDPVVSKEASSRIIEFERSASSISSKFGRTGNSRDSKISSGKRKSGSVLSSYYALRKRIQNEPFNRMDLNFLTTPNDGNIVGIEDEPLPENCMLGNPYSDHIEVQETNMNTMNCSCTQISADGGGGARDECTTDSFRTIIQKQDDEGFPADAVNIHKEIPHILGENQYLVESGSGVAELHESKELPVNSLFDANDLMVNPSCTFDQINNDPENICSEFEGSQVFSSPIVDYGLSIWRTNEGLSGSVIPADDGHGEKELQGGEMYALPDDVVAKSDDASGHDVIGADSKLESNLPCEEMENQMADTEGRFVEISHTIMNDEPFFMDVDAKDVTDKSYFKGLSSFLASSPNNCSQDQMPDVTEAMTSETQGNLANVSCSRLGELDEVAGSCAADGPVSCDSEVLMPSSVSTSNIQFPELASGIICCILNTEDPEIPCNEDVFFPKQLCSLVQTDGRDPGQSRGSSQIKGSQMIPEMGQLHPFSNCRVKCKDSSCVAPKTDGFLANGSAQINSRNVTECTLQQTLPREKSKEIIPGKHLSHSSADSLIEEPALCSGGHSILSLLNSFAIKQEMDARQMIKDHQASNAEVGSMDIMSPEPFFDHPPPVLEQLMIESDDKVPYFSDVEAMILDMDLDPDDQDLCDPEVARYHHEDTKRAIIRLEQASHSYMQRAIASHGAFAVLYGRHSKHYIKKPKILLGRKTEDFVIDVDLGAEGGANKVSRRQATINMEEDGSFHLKNLGKCSVWINSNEVVQGQSMSLNSGCLIEIRGMPFIFEINQTCVEQYFNDKGNIIHIRD